jgi:TolB-like protein/DNA-binding winged helix-turn-helix (wHTH) protein/Tfp pilus assembly protein PilF
MVRNEEIEVECRASFLGSIVELEQAPFPGSIKFGEDFEFDSRACRLRRSGRVLKLERIPMEILAVLVEQRGQLVSREHIVERIWGKDVFLDTDNSINGAIRKVRQALRDNPEEPRFIQTVTGRGYRFIAPVTDPEVQKVVPAPQPQTPPQPQPPPHSQSQSDPPAAELLTVKRARSRWWVVFAISIAFMIALGAYLWSRSQTRRLASDGRLMLAVLPFENLTGDASQDYFSDGMTEEMIARLGSLDPAHLGVIARTSVMQYKHNKETLDQIGRELGVQYALEGSFRRDPGGLRITAQLIEVQHQTHLWARQYDREPGNLLAIQGEIAQEIANEIEARIGSNDRIKSRPSLSPSESAAYELYLKGRFFSNKRTVQGLRQATEYFQQAVAKDPKYAPAYAGLAESYALMGAYSGSPQIEFIAKARAAVKRALELDEGLPEAHTALAVIAQNYDWDWATAEKEYRRAIELNPNYATGHHWYAECLALQGRFGESFPEIESARQLDPLSLIIAADYGAILYFSRQYDRAIEQFRSVLDMEPNFPRAHMLVWAYTQKGLFADALADAEAWRQTDGSPNWSWVMIAYVSGRSGDQTKAKLALEQLKRLETHGTLDPLSFAVAYVGIGDNDKALGWLEKAAAERSSSLTALKVDPTYDPLRNDPRFQELVRRVGLNR